VTKKKVFITFSFGALFTTLYFLHGPLKLECYNAKGWKGLPETNTPA